MSSSWSSFYSSASSEYDDEHDNDNDNTVLAIPSENFSDDNSEDDFARHTRSLGHIFQDDGVSKPAEYNTEDEIVFSTVVKEMHADTPTNTVEEPQDERTTTIKPDKDYFLLLDDLESETDDKKKAPLDNSNIMSWPSPWDMCAFCGQLDRQIEYSAHSTRTVKV